MTIPVNSQQSSIDNSHFLLVFISFALTGMRETLRDSVRCSIALMRWRS